MSPRLEWDSSGRQAQLTKGVSSLGFPALGRAHLKRGMKTEVRFPRRNLVFQLLGQARWWFWMQCVGP